MDDSLPHEVRTATDPRQDDLHTVELSRITQVNPSIRLLRLSINGAGSAKVMFIRLEWDDRLLMSYSNSTVGVSFPARPVAGRTRSSNQ